MLYVILLTSSDIVQVLGFVLLGFIVSIIISFLGRNYITRFQQQMLAADMLSDIVASINKSIELKEERIVNLMMRVELLELRTKSKSIPGIKPIFTDVNQFDIRDVKHDISDITLSDTEKHVIEFLQDGPKPLSKVREEIGKSREHTSRVVSTLVRKGVVVKRTKDGQVLCQIPDQPSTELEF
jgi:biotin operon repressor